MTHASESTANAQVVPRCVLLVGESGAVPASLVGALDRRGLDIVIVRHAPQVMVELAPPGSTSQNISAKSPASDPPSAQGRDHPDADQPIPDPAPEESDPDARRTPGLSVVIVEPQQQPRVGELRHAVAAYYPAVRCWQYHAHGPDGHPALEAYAPPPELTPESPPASPPASFPASPPDSALGDPGNHPQSDGNARETTPTQFFVDVDLSKGHTSEYESPAPADDEPRVKGANQRLRSLVVKVDDPQPYDDGPLVSEDELAMLLGPDPAPTPRDDAGPREPGKLGISPDSRHDHGERE